MQYNRRKFIKLSGGIGAGLALGSVTGLSLLSSCNNEAKKSSQFGLQLYSLRDDLPKDPKGVLKQVASYGYTQIESYEGEQGMFWGMGNTGFRDYMKELNMEIVASHCDINKDFEKKAAEAAAIGMKYLICPWLGPQPDLDSFKKHAEDFNSKGEICKKNGIKFAYHNHDYSFKAIDGKIPQDLMMENTDPALVDFELDMYWVVAGGQDIETWLKKYKNRFRLCHVKDRNKTLTEDNGKNSIELGAGSINYQEILKTAKANGMEYFIVEQEAYPNGTPLQAIKACADYMKTLSI